MEQNDNVYIRLQQHLDRQAVGFPATRSGAEIRILKHIFTPEEAEIAAFLSYRPEPLQTIFEKVAPLLDSPEALEKMLDGIQKKGGIETRIKNGQKHYGCSPLVVGMFELQLGRLTPEFVRDFNEYTSNRKFGIALLSTALPQMRTIPVAKSIRPQQQVSTFDEVATLLETAQAPFVIIECICRKKKSMEGKTCRVTDRRETCLGIGDIGQALLQCGIGRQIPKSEAMSILEQNQKQGLVLQPSNTEKADFICSCCGCCCGMLGIQKSLPRPLDFWVSNYQAAVDAETCKGCGICQAHCQVTAVSVPEKKEPARVNLDRCIGCGVCVAACPTGSITLLKKPTEVRPPKTREDLYDIIMANKKHRLGKMKMTGKLIADAVLTKQTNLLKP
ncbi:MAG: 4Fe-4S binding protein [Desulfobacterales bacterium]|nr:4Fe-4S binding protein [Desulfobacterales bacterium]